MKIMCGDVNNRSFRWPGVALLLALVTSGCGDGSDTIAIQPAINRNLLTTIEQVSALPDYNIYRPTNLDATGAPLPLIVWTNGGCVRYDAAWQSLLDSWARAGFITIAPTIPSNGDDPRADPTGVDDQTRVLDWAYAENGRVDSPYAGHIDLNRVVAAGNSCGGIISLQLASLDNRVQSVFVLSGSSGFSEETAAAIMGNILVPVGYVVGGIEDIATGFARQDYEFLPVGVPAYLAQRSEGDHRTVSTDSDILLEVAEISTHWIDFTLYGNPQVKQFLLESPCGRCAPGTWMVEAKNLDLHVTR
jgi:predicted dienelactone hydrolase